MSRVPTTFAISPFLLAIDWPNPYERMMVMAFFLACIALPLFGYWLAVLDIRAYLRSLRGMLIRLTQPDDQRELPDWVRDETPPCLRALGLTWPCSEDDIKQSYRRLAKELHPDRGGDVHRFLMLQSHRDQAHHFLNQRSSTPKR